MSFTNLNNRVDYSGSNTTATFNYTFKVFDEDELRVTVVDSAGAETLLVISTDYTVTGVGEATGGTVVLVDNNQAWLDTTSAYLKSTYDITIRRVLPLTQESDFRNAGSYFASSHEDQFDRMVMIDQQQQDELDRCIKVPETEDGSGMEIPSATDRASKLFGFDSDGDPIATSAGLNTALTTAFSLTLLDDTTAAAARTTLGAQQDTTALTSLAVAPATDDALPIYDTSATAHKQITVEKLFTTPTIVTPTLSGVKLGLAASQTSGFTAAGTVVFYPCSASGGAFTVTLPAVASSSGLTFIIKKTDSSTNAVTIDGNSAETIDGAANFLLYTQYESVRLVCDGSSWHVLQRYCPFLDEVVVHTSNGYGSTNTVIARFTTTETSTGTAITYADSATAGASFTINIPGTYVAQFSYNFSAGNRDIGLSLGSNQLTTNIAGITQAHRLAHVRSLDIANSNGFVVSTFKVSTAGTVLRPHTDGGAQGTGTTEAKMRVYRVG